LQEASSKPTPPPKAATATAPPPAPPSGVEALVNAIVAKGEEIRKLKADKVDKADLQPHIAALLDLKNKYREATGKDYVAGAPAPATSTITPSAKSAAPAPVPSLDPKAQALADSINSKGEEIRKLKAAKSDKATLQPYIDQLLQLKAQFKELTGSDFGAPAAPPAKKEGKAGGEAKQASSGNKKATEKKEKAIGPKEAKTTAAPPPSKAPAPTIKTKTGKSIIGEAREGI